MRILSLLSERIHAALLKAGAPEDCDALVTYAKNPQFGDYQSNGVMSLAKTLKQNPRELAQTVCGFLEVNDLAESVDIAGPGFINITLKSEWLSEQLLQAQGEAKALVEQHSSNALTIVDYSGPNLAKEMHVGHLRSTIIGDAVANVLELLGEQVLRQNHVGDWGTQFGMLITLLDERQSREEYQLADLESFYREAKKRFDDDEGFANKARQNVVALQSGDERCRKLWESFTKQSFEHCFSVYQRLGVKLNHTHTRAESDYNSELPGIIEALEAQDLLKEDQGAKCVFLEGFTTKEGNPLPVIVQKSDGGYLYATTDLAALRYRANSLSASRVMYFVDIRQSLHFKQVFSLARLAGFVSDDIVLEHMPFGTMLGEDKRPFKTRSGDLVKLEDLLNEAEARALDIVSEKQSGLESTEKQRIARQVGIGAIKYADLSKNRGSDYVFSWDAMLSFEGNTAPYLQYAYARVQSIFRKMKNNGQDIPDWSQLASFSMQEASERKLALKLMQFNDVLESVAANGFPHYLCEYLFELTQTYMGFYETCPVLSAEDENLRSGRLYLCQLSASTLKLGLDALGIETPESM